MIVNNTAYKYETQYNGKFVITKCCTNGTVTVQCGAMKIRHNIRQIKTYASDTNVKDIKIEKYV